MVSTRPRGQTRSSVDLVEATPPLILFAPQRHARRQAATTLLEAQHERFWDTSVERQRGCAPTPFYDIFHIQAIYSIGHID
jgi:hypothetical protein